MMNIAFVVAVWKRRALAEFVLRHINGMLMPGDSLIVVGSPDDNGWESAVPAGAVLVSADNHPLGAKWQAGISAARKTTCGAVMCLGSDDLPSVAYVQNARAYVGRWDTDVVGLLGVTQWRASDGACVDVAGYMPGDPRHGEPIGSGRTFSRRLLDRLNWHLFCPITRGLDGNLWEKIPADAATAVGPQAQLGWLLDVKAGEDISEVASGEGVTPTTLEAAGIPSWLIEELRAKFPPKPVTGWAEKRAAIIAKRVEGHFPAEVLRPDMRVLDLYCGGFLGMNAAAFVADAGIASYEGVDTDVGKLDQMKAAYPASFRFTCMEEEFVVAGHIQNGAKFDLVIVDPWTNGIPAIWARVEQFKQLLAPGGLLLLGALNEEKAAHPEIPFHHRGDYIGGVWWGMIRA